MDSSVITATLTQLQQSPVTSPCAACKVLRRRCLQNCVLAPYFPPNDSIKFASAHRVFGASNIIKLLQELPERQRADAVSSMVYEANARLHDPVYGCAGTIYQLQKQINELQAQLAKARAEINTLRIQYTNLASSVLLQPSQSQLFGNAFGSGGGGLLRSGNHSHLLGTPLEYYSNFLGEC